MIEDEFPDDLFEIQKLFPEGIYSHQTAVMLHNLSTFSPFTYYMTFPSEYHSDNFEKMNVTPDFVSEKYYEIGIEEVESWFGNKVRTYNKERTVIDALLTFEMLPYLSEILRNYFWDEERNIERLMKYAKLWNVEELVAEQIKKYEQ